MANKIFLTLGILLLLVSALLFNSDGVGLPLIVALTVLVIISFKPIRAWFSVLSTRNQLNRQTPEAQEIAILIQQLNLPISDLNPIRQAADALVNLGKPAVEPLVRFLTTPGASSQQKAWVITVLGRIGDKRAVEPLIHQLEPRTAILSVIKALELIGEESAVPAIIPHLYDSDEYVTGYAAFALTKLGQKGVDALIEALNGRYMVTRQYAARALGDMGEERAVLPLIRLLTDPEAEVQATAAYELSRIGTPEAMTAASNWRRNRDSP